MSRFLVLRDTVRLAERDVHCRPPEPRARIDLPPGLRSLVDARVFVGDCCLRWRLRDLLGPAADLTTDVLRVVASQPDGPAQLTVDWEGLTLGIVLLPRHGAPLASEAPLPPGRAHRGRRERPRRHRLRRRRPGRLGGAALA